jgi:hypothetical protein
MIAPPSRVARRLPDEGGFFVKSGRHHEVHTKLMGSGQRTILLAK